jgi:ubiquinone/menaquinone biosynthesis C-methylase UbiE
MLARTLEPEVMDTPEEAQDYDTMDHSAVNRVFVADFLNVWDGCGPVLDAGTGTAQIPIALCQQHLQVEITAIDFAAEMLKLAAANVMRAGLDRRIRLEHCDAKRLPYADASFRAVISNSIVHHIPEPVYVLREMVRMTRPGGRLFIRDLLRPGDDAQLRRLVQMYAGNANAHQEQMFEASLRAALTLDEIRQLVRELGFLAETVRQTTDRHWTWTARRAQPA